jgi:hypothetical protein
MQRFCTQPIKIPFNSVQYAGTELTQILPSCGNAISKIRIVLYDIINTRLEEIIQEAEIIGIEKLYGEFIRVENDSITPIEKQQTRLNLLKGPIYIDLPFYCIKNIYFGQVNLRILFSNGGNSQLNGHFLIDYVASDTVPTNMYFQRTRHVALIKAPIQNSQQIKLDVYLPGPAYEMYFTVRDASGNFINLIKNVTLQVDDRERFNLSGDYLQYIEPLKKHGGKYASNVYYYSFGLNPEDYKVPSGQMYFSVNQKFIFDLWPCVGTYVLTMWSCSHNLVYNGKKVFDSSEILLNYSSYPIQNLSPVTIKSELLNTLYKSTISYSSDYEVTVTTSTESILSPGKIVITGIDPVNQNSNVQITYSSPGFSNLVCTYNLLGTKHFVTDQVYDSFIHGSDYAFIDDNGIVQSLRSFNTTATSFYLDPYKNYVFYDSINATFSKNESVIYNVTGYPSSYFDMDVIPVTGGIHLSTGSLISTSYTILSTAVDDMYIYALDTTSNLYQYNKSTLQIVNIVNGPNTITSGTIILSDTGIIVLYNGWGVITYDKNLNIIFQIHKPSSKNIFIDVFNNLYLNATYVIEKYDKNGNAVWSIQISGCSTLNMSFGNNIILAVLYSTGTQFVIHNTNGSIVYVKNVPSGYSMYACFDTLGTLITSTYNGNTIDYNSYFNKLNPPYQLLKYDGTYFVDPVTHHGFTLTNFLYWSVYVYSAYNVVTYAGTITADSYSNVYMSVLTTNKTTYIYNAHGKSPKYIQKTQGYSASIISLNKFTSDINWTAVVDGMGSEYTYGCYSENSNVFLYGQCGPLPTNIYNSDKTIFDTIPSQTSIGGFLVKYTNTGFVQWFIYCTTKNTPCTITSATTDSNGNIYALIAVHDNYSITNDTLNLVVSGSIVVSYSMLYGEGITVIAKCTTGGTYVNSVDIYTGPTPLFPHGISCPDDTTLYADASTNYICTINSSLNPTTLQQTFVNHFGISPNNLSVFSTGILTDIHLGTLLFATSGQCQFTSCITVNGYMFTTISLESLFTYTFKNKNESAAVTFPNDYTIQGTNGILVKFNQTDTVQILCSISSPHGGRNAGYSVTSDSSNNLYFTGIYTGNGSIIQDANNSYYPTLSSGDPSIVTSFTVKLDLNGNIIQIT